VTTAAQRLCQSILSAWDNEARTENISSHSDEREVIGSAVEAANMAAVAVLRELARDADTGSQDDGVAPFNLRDLADTIEAGFE